MKSGKYKKYTKLLIKWHDSTFWSDEWISNEQAVDKISSNRESMTTIGFYIGENTRELFTADTYYSTHVYNLTSIPKSEIIEIKEVK